jgi:hypothetical protein
MSKWVRSVNMRLQHMLWNIDRSHIRLIFASPLDRYDHTRHGLHFTLRGKEKLVQLIADEMRCKPYTGKISVVTDVRSRPF